MDKRELGDWGENAAAEYLRRAGCEILARNYKTKCGEIDIVAREKGALLFIEVKTRSGTAFGTPGQAVDLRKQRKIARVAACYLQSCGWEGQSCRFDVVEVYKVLTQCRLRWIKDAFETH